MFKCNKFSDQFIQEHKDELKEIFGLVTNGYVKEFDITEYFIEKPDSTSEETIYMTSIEYIVRNVKVVISEDPSSLILISAYNKPIFIRRIPEIVSVIYMFYSPNEEYLKDIKLNENSFINLFIPKYARYTWKNESLR